MRRGARARLRRAASRERARTSPPAGRRPCDRRIDRRDPVCLASRTLTPKRVPSCSKRAHLRAPVDRDEHERRLQRDGHERIGRHPVHLLGNARREDGHAGREHPERPPEGDCRIALETLAELERVGRRRHVVRRAERLRRCDGARHRDLELGGLGRFHERILTQRRERRPRPPLSPTSRPVPTPGSSPPGGASRRARRASSASPRASAESPCPERCAGTGTGAARWRGR